MREQRGARPPTYGNVKYIDQITTNLFTNTMGSLIQDTLIFYRVVYLPGLRNDTCTTHTGPL